MSVRLFVGNLPYGVTESEMREVFSAAGKVSQVRIPTDRDTGKPRGFAFVDFEDRSEAEEAIRRFNQYMFKDRAMAVNEARARESAPAAGGAARPPSRPTPAPRPDWSGPLDSTPEDDPGVLGQPRRTFGAGVSTRDKRKPKGRAAKDERRPKGPIRERGGGQLFLGTGLEDGDEDQAMDDFALWAREDGKNRDEE